MTKRYEGSPDQQPRTIEPRHTVHSDSLVAPHKLRHSLPQVMDRLGVVQVRHVVNRMHDVAIIAPPFPPVDAAEVEEGVETKVEHLFRCVVSAGLEQAPYYLSEGLGGILAFDARLWLAHIWVVGRSSD